MEGMPPDNGYLPPPSSVQIKTAKTQKHLYCLVFTKHGGSRCLLRKSPVMSGFFLPKRRFFSVPKRRCKIAVFPCEHTFPFVISALLPIRGL